jgi:hypothetical protein
MAASISRIASAPILAGRRPCHRRPGRRELFLGQQLAVGQVGQARLDHHVVLEVEDPLQIAQRHVQHQADAAGQRLEEPDMRDRGGQLDMAHALAADLLQRDLDAAFLADDAAILHALVLAAEALVVLDRPEDPGAEQAVTLGLEGPVVDRLGLLDLAVGPAERIRSGEASEILISSKVFGGGERVERVVGQFLVHLQILEISAGGGKAGFSAFGRAGRARIFVRGVTSLLPPHPGVPC